MAIKRLHYFDHQFLLEGDFTEEQKYHLDMRRRLSRLLYTHGIAGGLEIAKSASKAVTVRPGTGMDRDGREMIVETDQVIDLSDAAQFPAGATVFITIAYREQESDPSTATGAPGNTRITELPIVRAVTAAPPTDGTVVRLARFTLDGTANVPGNINDTFDGGVRQTVSPRGGLGLASLDGVSNPGGNIDLVPVNAVTIVPDDPNNRITIGETHSALTNNPHNVTAAQIGALLASDYDLRRRALATLPFTQADANGAQRTVPVGFQPRMVLVVGTCTVLAGSRSYGGGVSAFADLGTTFIQQCFGFGVTRFSNTDWFYRGVQGAGICLSTFFNQEAAPFQAENLAVTISSVSATGLTATLTRSLVNPQTVPLPNFAIALSLLCLG